MSEAIAALSAVATVLLDIDPRTVRPGWTPLLILVGLLIALTLLYLSLRRQIRKIHLPYRDEIDEVEEPAQDESVEPPNPKV